MGKPERKVSKFKFEGRFLRFEQDHRPKSLWLATAEGEYQIKLSKKLQASLGQVLTPGDWVEVAGRQKLNFEKSSLKLKASRIRPASPKYTQTFPQPLAKPTESKLKILVCQKSPCMRRGACSAYQELTTAVRDRGLEDQITVKATGCMNRCKAGPNVVFMPGKARYSHVQAQEISTLINKHFPAGNSAPQRT